MRHIVIGTPWVSAFMHTAWVDAALKLHSPDGVRVEWFRGLGWCDARRVHNIIEHALEEGADFVAFLDGDVIIPPNWLEGMLKHLDAGRQAVASVIPMRGRALDKFAPFEPMAWKAYGNQLVPIACDMGIQMVDYASLGACLFDMNVFITGHAPWAGHEYDHQTWKPEGSTADSILFRHLKRDGVQLWADPDIDVQHLHTFAIDRTYSERFPDWESGPV